jgi:predicted RNase H-like nuclease (RuvC/YqgF family)
MTKDELKQEAEKYVLNNTGYSVNEFHGKKAIQSYLAGAEPREKRIAELEATNKKISSECRNLVNSLEKKQNEIVVLKAQIEQMKCCSNCKHSRTEYEHCKTDKHEKWEIKEK